jgi:hypothetical protein
LRYLFSRLALRKQIPGPAVMADAVAVAHAEVIGCAAQIQYRLEMSLAAVLTRDAVAWLAGHIGRLIAALLFP